MLRTWLENKAWIVRGHLAPFLPTNGLRVNVGCGDFPSPGWLNIDLHADGPRPSVLASAAALPLASRCADAVYAGHFLEHLPPEMVGTVLLEFRRVLGPSGELCVVGPDLDRAERRFPEMVDVIRYGERRWEGDAHLWESRQSRVVEMVRAAGFQQVATPGVVRLPRRDWPVASAARWQLAVHAVAP